MAYFAELSASGLEPVRFEGSGDLDCLCIAKGGIEGWFDSRRESQCDGARAG